mgnify:CR=1 FL=1
MPLLEDVERMRASVLGLCEEYAAAADSSSGGAASSSSSASAAESIGMASSESAARRAWAARCAESSALVEGVCHALALWEEGDSGSG